MMASRGMGAIASSKMPTGKRKARRDDTSFTEYAEGGSTDKWIAGAIKKPGALRSALGVKEGKTIPAKKLAKAASAPGKLGQRARLAQTLKKMK
jgi:hypothetical protein